MIRVRTTARLAAAGTLLVALAVGCGRSSPGTDVMQRNVVDVYTEVAQPRLIGGPSRTYQQGCGIVFRNDGASLLVLTCRHVLLEDEVRRPSASRRVVVGLAGCDVPAVGRVLAAPPRFDLAIVEVKCPVGYKHGAPVNFSRLADTSAGAGIVIVKAADMPEGAVRAGKVSSVGSDHVATDIPGNSGMSGLPLVDPHTGRFAGLVQGTLPQSGTAVGVPAKACRDFIRAFVTPPAAPR